MNAGELARLDVIIGRIEALQKDTADKGAKDKLGKAKDELLRLAREQRQ